MSKRLISLMLALLLCLSLLPGSVSAAEPNKLIAFTFDDGPNVYTETLLDGLRSRNTVVTFFMNGVNGSGGVANYKKLVARMAQDGHQLANHTYSHASFSRLSASEVQKETSKVEALLFEAMGGSYTDLVRTPGGALTETIQKNVGAPIIFWSVDTRDWENRSEEKTYQNILRDSFDGAIVLMHDIHKTSVKAALRAVDTLKARGYEFVTVSELMRRRGVNMKNGEVYRSAKPNGTTLPAYRAPGIAEGVSETGLRTVTFWTEETGLTLRYTTDGTTPTLKSPAYTGQAISVKQDTLFTVAGFDKYGTRTPTTSQKVKADAVKTPTYTCENGIFSLYCSTPDTTLYYTTDGSDPAESGILYTSPLRLSGTVKAVAVKRSGMISAPLTVTVTPHGEVFTDLFAREWYYEAVCEEVEAGYMGYTGDATFTPCGTMTRAMLVTVLYRMEGKPTSFGNAVFTDVDYGSWYGAAVLWAYGNGIVSGTDDTHFAPNAPITREQLVALLCRYARLKGVNTYVGADLSRFTDQETLSDYAYPEFAFCVKHGIITGVTDTTLAPRQTATRAQCAVLLVRFGKLL